MLPSEFIIQLLLEPSIENQVMRFTRHHVDSVKVGPEILWRQVALISQVDDCQRHVAGLTHQR